MNMHNDPKTNDENEGRSGPANRDMSDMIHGLDMEAALAAAFGPVGNDSGIPPAARIDYEPGTRIADRYELIECIGEGGMGTVWYANQKEPVKRKVAIKLVKPGMSSRSVLTRFEAERQALALMEHPNIARVFDGGITDRGVPFFAMELVRGISITTWCEENHASIEQRLELLIPVCRAIHHAHQKGIIHRDIKPSNVMIALYDGIPVPKVIDFGVAKALNVELHDSTVHTAFGAVVGTVEYMSPEQAELNNLDIDTRSDVYSLGVLIYELLAGSPPFPRAELAKQGWQETMRIIREVDPERPSVRLSTSKTKARTTSIRGQEMNMPRGHLSQDLDWVVMKCLEKDRDRRYESAASLADDLRRYLQDEPVNAYPPSLRYRITKFVRQYRWQTVASMILLMSLIGGVVGTTWGLIQAESQRALAELAKKDAETRAASERLSRLEAERLRKVAEAAEDAVLESYRASTDDAIEKLIGSKPQLGREDRNYLESALQRWQAFAELEERDDRSRAIRAEAMSRMAQIWRRLGEVAQAQAGLEMALPIWKDLVTVAPSNEQWLHGLALCYRDLGMLQRNIGKFDMAIENLKQAVLVQQDLVKQYALEPRWQIRLGIFHSELAKLLLEANRENSEDEYENALSLLGKLVLEYPENSEFRMDLAKAYNGIGSLKRQIGKLVEAEAWHLKALNTHEEVAKKNPTDEFYREAASVARVSYALVLYDIGRKTEAESHCRTALEEFTALASEFSSRPGLQQNLAWCHRSLALQLDGPERWKEAELNLQAAAMICAKLSESYPSFPDYRRDLALAHYNLSIGFRANGKKEEALQHCQTARSIEQSLVLEFSESPEYRYNLANTSNSVGLLLVDFDREAEAEVEYSNAIDAYKHLVANFPNSREYRTKLAGCYCNLGALKRKAGQAVESIVWLDDAITELQKVLDNNPQYELGQQFLRNAFWNRARAKLLLNEYSDVDWNRTVELTRGDRKPDMQVRQWIAKYRVGDAMSAIADLASMSDILDSIRKKSALTAIEFFDIACIYATASQSHGEGEEHAEHAFEFARRAVGSGFADVEKWDSEPALDQLRDRVEFVQLRGSFASPLTNEGSEPIER